MSSPIHAIIFKILIWHFSQGILGFTTIIIIIIIIIIVVVVVVITIIITIELM